jgi:hypothetical protein
MNQSLPLEVVGHVLIKDDLGNVLLDKGNAVHPQNMGRVIARALAHESNYFINRIAFGNGGTVVDAAYHITYRTPNDGQAPDTAGWRSTLYNETYTEIVDESNAQLGSDPFAPGASKPTSDPAGTGVTSSKNSVNALQSVVTINMTLNPYEPNGQDINDLTQTNTESNFTFDEIGLYTTGASHQATAGYQDVNVGGRVATDDTGLGQNTLYTFSIIVNGGTTQTFNINTGVGSGLSGQILYGDLVNILNSSTTNMVGVSTMIDDPASPTILTYGMLRFLNTAVATTAQPSTIQIVDMSGTANWLFTNLNIFSALEAPIAGQLAGVEDDPINPTNEGERLLTHIIFSPVLKSNNRTLSIIYTLTISVARSV